ncbi:MAG TPA: hypothetical protein VH475_07610 [Tepidisphaeraceae bacterium]
MTRVSLVVVRWAARMMIALGAAQPETAAGADGPAGRAGRDTLSVLIVTEGNPFLNKAIAATPDVAVRTITPKDYRADRVVADVTVFDRHVPTELPKRGGLLFVDCLPKGGALKAVMDEKGAEVMLTNVRATGKVADHPAVRGIVPKKVYVETVRMVDAGKGWGTLIDGDRGPLVLGSDAGRREIVVTFDLAKSNWPLQASFPVFVRQAIEYLGTAGAVPEGL